MKEKTMKPDYEKLYNEEIKANEEFKMREMLEKKERETAMYNKINMIYDMLVDKKFDEQIKENLKKIEEIKNTMEREQNEIQYIYQDINFLNDRRCEEKRMFNY